MWSVFWGKDGQRAERCDNLKFDGVDGEVNFEGGVALRGYHFGVHVDCLVYGLWWELKSHPMCVGAGRRLVWGQREKGVAVEEDAGWHDGVQAERCSRRISVVFQREDKGGFGNRVRAKAAASFF